MGTTKEKEGGAHGIDIVGRAAVAETGGSSGGNGRFIGNQARAGVRS